MPNMRTLLEVYGLDQKKYRYLDNVTFSIIACRSANYGGFPSNQVLTKVIDNHYLLERVFTVGGFIHEPFGIESYHIDNQEKTLDRMYNEAKKLAEDRAKFDGNKVLVLTSRVKILKSELVFAGREFYVPSNMILEL
jgi:hypothetical protein